MILLLPMLLACQEFTLTRPDDPPVADPPGSESNEWGEAPDWSSCEQRYDGRYFNLPGDHPDLLAAADTGDTGFDGLPAAPADPTTVDWWDRGYQSFTRLDATLDQGGNWWPVDDGLQGDPGGWSARWLAWVRVTDGGWNTFVLGAATDAWLLIDGAVVAQVGGDGVFQPQSVDVELSAGQRRLELRVAHRGGESGLSFRAADDGLAICVGE